MIVKNKKKLDWFSGSSAQAITPTIQASNVLVTSSDSSSAILSLTRGNGLAFLVVAHLNSYVDSDPVDGALYSAGDYGSGSEIGTGNFVVYSGILNAGIPITGLPAGLIFLRVYEFNGTKYLTSSDNTISVLTLTAQVKATNDYGIAQGYVTPPVWNLMRDDQFIRDLGSQISRADQLVIYNTQADSNYSLINVLAPGTRNHQIVLNGGAVSFSKLSGHTPSSSAYIRTNYIPSTHAVNFAINDAGIVIYTPTNASASGTANFFGSCGASLANGITCSLRFTGDVIIARFNASSSTSAANATTSGLYQFKRTASNAFVVFKELVQILTSSVVATGLSAFEIVVDALNNNGTVGSFDTKTIGGVWMIGASFDQTVVKPAVDSLLSYTTPVTVKPVTGFPVWDAADNLDGYLTKVEELATNFSPYNPSNLTTSPPLDIASEYLVGDTQSSGGTAYQCIVNLPGDQMMLVPSNATVGVLINTINDTFANFGSFAVGSQKWSGGQYCSNGLVPWCPYNATEIAVIDTLNGNSVKYYDTTGEVLAGAGNLTGSNKWFGWKLGSDGLLYGIPYDASSVLRFNPVTKAVQFIDTTGIIGSISGNLSGLAKWDGGTCWENLIIGSTSTAQDVLEITCHATTPTVARVDATFPVGTNKYALSLVGHDGTDSFVYMFPYATTNIAKYNPRTKTHTTISDSSFFTGGSTIKAGTISVMPDGKILATGYTGYATLFNPITEALTKFTDSNYTGKGWISSAINSKGHIYSCPADNTKILKQRYRNINFELEENLCLSRYSHY